MRKTFLMFALAVVCSQTVSAQNANTELNDGKHLNEVKFSDNWYFGVNAGGIYSWGNYFSEKDFSKHLGAAGGLQLGKKLSPLGDARLQLLYTYNKGYFKPSDDVFGFSDLSLTLDWLPNFTNFFCGYKEDRKFTFSGILGLGGTYAWGRPDDEHRKVAPEMVYGDHKQYLFVHAGVKADYALNDKYHLNVELANYFYPASYSNNVPRTLYEGHANLMVGFTYHFKNSDGSRKFTYSKGIDQSKYEATNAEINKLKSQIEDKKEHPNIRINKVIVKTHTNEAYVSFAAKKSNIEFSQEPTLYKVSENAKQHDKDVIYITRKGTDSNKYFTARAEAVKKELVEKRGVDESKINIVENASDIQVASDAMNVSYIYIND